MESPGEITELLNQADAGNVDAADRLFRLLECELKAVAGKRKKKFLHGIEDSTTALVDEAFCKLVGQNVTCWEPGDRRKFFAYAANKIHDLLVAAARSKDTKKRGGGFRQTDFDGREAADSSGKLNDDLALLLDLKAALKNLDEVAPKECQVFRLRYFLGTTFDEVATLLEISATQAKTLFRKAQMVLRLELKDYRHDP